jgi:hypothetical protein
MKSLIDIAVDFREQYPNARDYKVYADIPPESLTEGFLIAWVVLGGEFSRIPNNLRTELMKRIAVSYDARALAHIVPDEVQDYPSLVVDAVCNAPRAVSFIKEDYITEDLIVRLARNGVSGISGLNLGDTRKHLVTDSLISQIVQIGPYEAWFLQTHLRTLASDRIKDDDIKIGVMNKFREVDSLSNMNKVHIMADLLRSGYWPNEFRPQDMTRTNTLDMSSPPASPVEIMNRVIEIKNQAVRLWHFQSFRMFPLEEVIATTQGMPNATDFIMRVYSEAELKPYLRLSRELRGKVLESVLGL